MSETRHDVELRGCAPVPLAHYLKALGILRLVAEQVDPQAQGWWDRDVFWLRSTLDAAALVEFFSERYSPTPLVGPWGARSGFFPGSSEKGSREALDEILKSESPRLESFRLSIDETRKILRFLKLESKADNDEDKLRLLQACRSMMSDHLLCWLDAVYVLLNDDRAFPPLLGTGGNEGSGSYMSGFAQQVVSLVVKKESNHALLPALFGRNVFGSANKQTPGQFSPSAAGGPNATTGFEGSASTNPWDYVLTLEGTLVFAASAVKQLEDRSDGYLAYPFCVRPTCAGYPSADIAEESTARAEMWFPIWQEPARFNEVKHLFNEGRATVHQRHAKTGTDFARAVCSFGLDRGISRFERYAFLKRNGLSYFAVHLGRFISGAANSRLMSLIDNIDTWLDRFRGAATGKNAPASAGRALRQLESAILDLCSFGRSSDALTVLIALGGAEAALARSPKLRENGIAAPVPRLSEEWLKQTYDDTTEYRLAAALASIWHEKIGPFRRHLEPIDEATWSKRPPRWASDSNDPAIVWGSGQLVRNLNAALHRRVIDIIRLGTHGNEELHAPLGGHVSASLGDIAAFIEGRVDDRRIDSLLRALILVDWKNVSFETRRRLAGKSSPHPDSAYSLIKLCHLAGPLEGTHIRLTPTITRRAIAGDGAGATQLARRRLRSSGLAPAVDVVPFRGDRMRRIAAAVVFPIDRHAAKSLMERVIRPDQTFSKEETYPANMSARAE